MVKTTHTTSLINSTRVKIVLSAIVVVLALFYLIVMAFPRNTQFYITVGELLENQHGGQTKIVRVIGQLDPESFKRESGTTRVEFIITEDKQILPATYDGIVPDLFFNPNSQLVLEGQYDPKGVFNTKQIIVKCPSKYERQDDPEIAG